MFPHMFFVIVGVWLEEKQTKKTFGIFSKRRIRIVSASPRVSCKSWVGASDRRLLFPSRGIG